MGSKSIYPDEQIVEFVEHIAQELEQGSTLEAAVTSLNTRVAPARITMGQVVKWVERNTAGIRERYMEARRANYVVVSEKLAGLAAETHSVIWLPVYDPETRLPVLDDAGEPVLRKDVRPLSAEVLQSKKLQLDTWRWILSKKMPEVYGDKVVVGADRGSAEALLGGLDVKNLSEDELKALAALLAKASKPNSEA